MNGLHLRHLRFTGPNVAPEGLEFVDGLNIIFGASNTGKSFVSKSILFMLGASSSLPDTDEINAYDAVWLGITLGDQGDFTLYRPTQGGNLKIYPGLVRGTPATNGVVLRDRHDRNRTDTVSHRLLEAIGLAGKWVVRDGNGTKDSLSIRTLSKYLVVAENDILAEESPVFLSGTPAERHVERNLFKLLLTGRDDSAAVTVPKPSERKVAKAAKIELVDEMLAQLDAELSEASADEQESKDQLARLDENAGGLQARLQTSQGDLDAIVVQRRGILDQKRELTERADELDLTLQRFAKLQAVYASDLERLHSIEEGGYVLAAMAGRDCPVCGAPPDSQTHNRAAEEISMAYTAAAAEARKIEREQRELVHVVASLEAEVTGLRKTISKLGAKTQALDDTVESLRRQEASLRESYEAYAMTRAGIVKVIDLFDRRAKLAARRADIGAEPTRRESEAPLVGPDSTTLFAFGETVKAVLTAWKFPDAEKVQFDAGINDITIGGKPRAANGKGVRAVLHSAFNVAVFVHCIEKKLPHPGFLVLDTPLLTYREPLTSRHGDLAQDEQTLKSSSLAEHFYKHLASLREHVQVIVIENSDPPQAIRPLAHIEVFTGQLGEGRFGLLAS
jgi:predicted  nucleic acid-binding Zn-ribbon protein